jgi:catechol 2,3-dioxygenase-like lactoylglutathione lyase family enzyme
MLAKSDLVAFVATTDFARARPFYAEVLGLPLVHEDDFALVFDANGTSLRVSRVEELHPPGFTVLGWDVADIAQMIRDLSANGVTFERYGFLPQDELGIWTTPDGSQVAWFKDPDGNTLSLSQLQRG